MASIPQAQANKKNQSWKGAQRTSPLMQNPPTFFTLTKVKMGQRLCAWLLKKRKD